MKTISRSKYLVLALFALLLSFAAGVTAATATDTPAANVAAGSNPPPPTPATEERIRLATEYIDNVPVENEIKAAIDKLSNAVNPEQRVLFRSLADTAIDYKLLRQEAIKATADLFTEDEIRAMTTFFSSPSGKAIRAKMPLYEERMQPAMNTVMQAFGAKLQENNIQLTAPASQ